MEEATFGDMLNNYAPDQFEKEYEDVEIATYWIERGRMLIYGS